MAIYYTDREGGILKPLPVKSSRGKVVKHLRANRKKDHSHIPMPNNKFSLFVHSVFFIKGNKVMRVWDSARNGYRPNRIVKRMRFYP